MLETHGFTGFDDFRCLRLARPAGDITVADVVLATEGSIATLRSGPAAPLWADLERTVANFLTARTLTALEGDTR